jgi:hypothetical protein
MPNNEPVSPPSATISIDQLIPNSWNPNRMSDSAFQEYVAEVRHLGTLPKPVVCRPLGDKLGIIDGAHGLLAAMEVGLTHVPCVVIDADDFEAMRQTYKRNRGGEDDPLLLGQMFQRMLDLLPERDRSVRGLSRSVEVPEATLRFHLDYARAAELRKACAPDTDLREVAELNHEQVQIYRNLPDRWRDMWLDDGADIEFLKSLCPEPKSVGTGITKAGLEHLIDAERFRPSLDLAWHLAMKRLNHHRVADIDAYIAPLAATRLDRLNLFPPADVLDLLPYRVSENGSAVTVLISPQDWTKILQSAAARAWKPKRFYALVQNAVLGHLRTRGINPEEIYGPEIGKALQLLDTAPEFIRSADFLSLDERLRLAMAQADGVPEEIVLRAKEMTVAHFQKVRVETDDPGADDGTVLSVFEICVRRLLHKQRMVEEDKVLADRDHLLNAVLGKLTVAASIAQGDVDGRPATEVLAERLQALSSPEFALLAAGLLGSADPARHWLRAMGASKGTVKNTTKRLA